VCVAVCCGKIVPRVYVVCLCVCVSLSCVCVCMFCCVLREDRSLCVVVCLVCECVVYVCVFMSMSPRVLLCAAGRLFLVCMSFVCNTHRQLTHKHVCRVYGVATISRLLKIIRLFCKRAL